MTEPRLIFSWSRLLMVGAVAWTVGCAASPPVSQDWAQDLVRLKQENAQYKEQLRVAHLKIQHLERRGERFKKIEDQIFQAVQESYREKNWELLRSQVDQITKDFLRSDARVVESVYYLAELSRQLGKDTQALQAYDWLQNNPAARKFQAGTYLGMGLVYGQMGLHAEAQDYFSKILEKHPSSAEAVLASREISDLTHLRGVRGRKL